MTNPYKVAIVDEEKVEFLGDATIAESLENTEDNPIFDYEDLKTEDRLIAIAKDSVKKDDRYRK